MAACNDFKSVAPAKIWSPTTKPGVPLMWSARASATLRSMRPWIAASRMSVLSRSSLGVLYELAVISPETTSASPIDTWLPSSKIREGPSVVSPV